MIPSLPAYMFFEAVKRWLQMQSVVMPLLYIVLVIAGVNVFITWLFVDGFGLGFTVRTYSYRKFALFFLLTDVVFLGSANRDCRNILLGCSSSVRLRILEEVARPGKIYN